jgi:hypothetical protein
MSQAVNDNPTIEEQTAHYGRRQQIRSAMEHALSLLDDMHDAALEELRQGAREGTYRGDPYDATDDCESVITVRHGDLRKARSILRQALSGSLAPLPEHDR